MECKNHEIARTLLEYAATNGSLQGKSIPIKSKSQNIAEGLVSMKNKIPKLFGEEIINSNIDLVDGDIQNDVEVEAPESEFDCRVRQSFHCGPNCYVPIQGDHERSQTLKGLKSAVTVREKAFVRSTPASVEGSAASFHHFHVLEEDVKNPFESAFFTREEVANPLLRACLLDDYEMIMLLLEYGFVIWDQERVDNNREMGKELPGDMRQRDKSDAGENSYYPFHPDFHTEWFLSFASQRALCSPSYINLTESRTMMRCLELAGRFEQKAQDEINFQEIYESLRESCVRYATDLLDVCRDDGIYDGDGDDPHCAAQEMDVALGLHYGEGKAQLSPLIETAMSKDIVEFFTHDKCYRSIEKMWNPGEPDVKGKNAYGTTFTRQLFQLWQIILVTVQAVLTLMLAPVLYFFQKPISNYGSLMEIKMSSKDDRFMASNNSRNKGQKLRKFQLDHWLSSMATPSNSYAGSIIFYLMNCSSLSFEAFVFTKKALYFVCPLDFNSTLALVFIMGWFFHLIEMMMIKKMDFWRYFWNIYSSANVLLFLATYLLWFYQDAFTSWYIDTVELPLNVLCERKVNNNYLWPSSKYMSCRNTCHVATNNSHFDRCKILDHVYWNSAQLPDQLVQTVSQRDDQFGHQILNSTIVPYFKAVVATELTWKIGMVMLICQFAHVFQFHKALGMMNLMMVNIISLITYFAIIFFLYAFCFALAIHMTYVNYQGMWQITLNSLTNLPTCQTIQSKYPYFGDTLASLFWALFGYANVENSEIFLPNLRKPKKTAQDRDEYLDQEEMLKFRALLCQPGLSKESFHEIMAMEPLNYTAEDITNDFNFAPNKPLSPPWIGGLFLGLYHVFAIIVMLNLLVALMSNGFEKGTSNS